MTDSDGRRGKRVAELVRLHFSEVMRREADDPMLVATVVTTVKVSPDLSVATLGVRLLAGDSPEARKKLLKRLNRASNLLRRGLAQRLDMRKAPELRFNYDTGHDAEARVDELLDEIHRDKRGEE
jgi:ribosome-binding factor A